MTGHRGGLVRLLWPCLLGEDRAASASRQSHGYHPLSSPNCPPEAMLPPRAMTLVASQMSMGL